MKFKSQNNNLFTCVVYKASVAAKNEEKNNEKIYMLKKMDDPLLIVRCCT